MSRSRPSVVPVARLRHTSADGASEAGVWALSPQVFARVGATVGTLRRRPDRAMRRLGSSLRGFTLVELLVVIGIIAVLVSILLPSLARARQHALSTKCAANMRQVAMACLMYANENRGVLPVPAGPFYQQRVPWTAIWQPGGGLYDYDQGSLWPYVGASVAERQALMNCPADPDPRLAGDGSGVVVPSHPRNFSYSFNFELYEALPATPGQVIGNGWVTPVGLGWPLSAVRSPAHKLLVLELEHPSNCCDSASSAAAGVTPNSQVACLLTQRHMKMSNVGFCDGHVEPMDPLIFACSRPSIRLAPAFPYYMDLFKGD